MADGDDVDLSELFPETAHVLLFRHEGDEQRPVGDPVARAAVAQDGTLEVAGLEGGEYWMTVDGREAIRVTAKGGKVTRVGESGGRGGIRPMADGERVARVAAERDEASTLVHGDPKSYEETLAPPARRIVTGARTSANTRMRSATVKGVARTADQPAGEQEPIGDQDAGEQRSAKEPAKGGKAGS